jgi:MYXO-CTERM domain-containing protein
MEIFSMVTKLLSASAILTVAGMASGATFGVNTIDAGGVTGGSLGAPITWTGGAAFNPGTGSDRPASPNGIFGVAALGVDSYVAIDPIGPSTASSTTSSTDGYQAAGPSNIISPTSPTTIFQADRLTGIWFNTAQVQSGPGDRLFIAQITLRAASAGTLNTAGVLVNIKDAGTVNADGELGALKFGLANATNNGGKWGQSYYLTTVARPATGATGAFVGGTSYAIYVQAVPTPGAAGLAGLAGLVALRRRR